MAFLLSTPSTQFIHETNSGSEIDSSINSNIQVNGDGEIGIEKNAGFWGPIDSGIDWCEPNYIVTNYVAEFGNTLSSIPMVFWALFGWYLCWKSGVKEKRYMILLISLGLIGIGSVAFHGTLRYSAQVRGFFSIRILLLFFFCFIYHCFNIFFFRCVLSFVFCLFFFFTVVG